MATKSSGVRHVGCHWVARLICPVILMVAIGCSSVGTINEPLHINSTDMSTPSPRTPRPTVTPTPLYPRESGIPTPSAERSRRMRGLIQGRLQESVRTPNPTVLARYGISLSNRDFLEDSDYEHICEIFVPDMPVEKLQALVSSGHELDDVPMKSLTISDPEYRAHAESFVLKLTSAQVPGYLPPGVDKDKHIAHLKDCIENIK